MPSHPQVGERGLWHVLDSLATPLQLISEDGTLLWVNAAELRLLGYAQSDYLGHNIEEFHVDRQIAADILCRLQQGREVQNYELRLRCKNGDVRKISLSATADPEDGRFKWVQCASIDTTEERHIFELKERLAAIVESSSDAIISKDLNGTILSWNLGAHAMFGYTAEEIVGKHISTLAAPGYADEIPNILSRIKSGNRVEHYETRRRAKDGRILAISLTVSPVRNVNGEIVGASKVARDISDRFAQDAALRQSNAELTKANSDLQLFAYLASHDLQEPLRMVSLYAEMLRKKHLGALGESGDQYVEYIFQGAQRMQHLLANLRSYIQSTTVAGEAESEIDADRVLDACLENLKASIDESGASIIRTELPSIRLLEFQLSQVLQNLISNAIRYRSQKPLQIRIAAERRERDWLFSVEDNGIGIEPQYQEKIFDLFQRLHPAAQYPGTGMGLAICQRIIERVGGRIWVESEHGRGSTFFFTIPL